MTLISQEQHHFRIRSSKRAVVVSVTEGPQMAVNHLSISAKRGVTIINKIELAGQMSVDIRKLANDAHAINAETAVTFANRRKR